MREPDWENLSGLLKDTVTPECCLAEVSTAITKATRRELITRNDARLKFQALLKLMEGNLRLARDADLLKLAFEMALGKAKLPVYDYLFIALAQRHRIICCLAQKQGGGRNGERKNGPGPNVA